MEEEDIRFGKSLLFQLTLVFVCKSCSQGVRVFLLMVSRVLPYYCKAFPGVVSLSDEWLLLSFYAFAWFIAEILLECLLDDF